MRISSHGWVRCSAYQLGIELRKARLAGIVEDKDGIDHDAEEAGFQPFLSVILPRRILEYRSMSSESCQVHCDCLRCTYRLAEEDCTPYLSEN